MNTQSAPSAGTASVLERALLAAGHVAFGYDASRDEVRLYGAVRAVTGLESGPSVTFARLLEAIHPDDRARARLFERRPRAMRDAYRVSVRFLHPDGTVVACEASGDLFEVEPDDPARASGDATGEAPPDVVRTGIVVPVATTHASFDRALHLAGILESVPETASVHTADGNCLSINATGRALLGIDADEDVGGLTLGDLVRDATSMPVSALLPTVLDHGSHATDVVLVSRTTGRHVPAAWSATLMKGAPEEPRFVVCIARDLRKTLEIEWQLRQHERRLTHALEVSRLGEWSMDIRTRSSHLSSRVAEIFGYGEALDDWSYTAFLEHVHGADRERVDRLFSRSLDTGRDLDFEARVVRGDGEHRWIGMRASINRGLAGEGPVIGGVVQDITERKFVEQRDRFLADVSVPLNTLVDHRSTLEQVARLAVPFLADHCSIDLADERGGLSRVVATSALLASEAVGDHSSAVAEAEREAFRPAEVRRRLEVGETVMVDVVEPALLDSLARTDSERQSLRALDVRGYLGVPLTLRGRRIGVLHFYRTDPDSQYTVTDVKVAGELAGRVAVALENARLYKALQDSDHRKDEFLAMLSHELRNPLESLAVGVSLIEADEQDGDWARDMMRGQITRLAGILEDLLDVSRYTFNKVVLERARTDLVRMLADIVRERGTEAARLGYVLEARLPEAPVHADIDVLRLTQVIGNLLTNALKYGGDRGRITVRLDVEPGRPGSSDARETPEPPVTPESPGHAVLEVSDEGVGIVAEELPGVFEMFSQVDTTIDRSRGGLGMGLTLVKRIVEMHGGTVEAASDGAGRGTRFTLRLPLSSSVAAEPDTAAPVPGTPSAPTPAAVPRAAEGGAASRDGVRVPSPANRRLMLVDDNLETVAALEKLFGLKGYEVRTAHDGLAAIALAEEFEPHLAVLDIGLPGASGYEVASALRERWADRPLLLVALSGYGQQKDRERSKEAGFDHHLLKPVNFRAVLALLEAGPTTGAG